MIFPVISVMQPWPYAMFHLGKDCENRSWRLPPRLVGVPVLIHAGKRLDKPGVDWLRNKGFRVPNDLPMGGIVGAVVFTGCTGSCKRVSEWAERGLMLQWWIGAARELPFHPYPGRLGFFSVDYPHPEGASFARENGADTGCALLARDAVETALSGNKVPS